LVRAVRVHHIDFVVAVAGGGEDDLLPSELNLGKMSLEELLVSRVCSVPSAFIT
jgi:hypothetical protein